MPLTLRLDLDGLYEDGYYYSAYAMGYEAGKRAGDLSVFEQ
jgi:hypothetical protein